MATNEPKHLHLDSNTAYVQMNPSGNPHRTACYRSQLYANTEATGDVNQVNGIEANPTGQRRALNTQRHTCANEKYPLPRRTIDSFTGLRSSQDPSWFSSGHPTPPPPPPCQPPPPYSDEDDTETLVHVTDNGRSSPTESSRSGSSDNSDSLIATHSSTYLDQTKSSKDGRELVIKLNFGKLRRVVVVLVGALIIVVVVAVLVVLHRTESNKLTNTDIRETPVPIFAVQSSTTGSFISQPVIGVAINPPASSSLSTTIIQKPGSLLLLLTSTTRTTTTTTVAVVDKAAAEAETYSTVCMIQKTCTNRPGDVHIMCPYAGDIGGIQAMDPGERNGILQSCLVRHGFVGGVEARSVCSLCKVSQVHNCLDEITRQFRPSALMKNCPPQE